GESQLCSIVITRAISILDTGDKRAIESFETLLDEIGGLELIGGRVRCLEQIVHGLVQGGAIDELLDAICAEPDVDKTLSICFGCYSGVRAAVAAVLEG